MNVLPILTMRPDNPRPAQSAAEEYRKKTLQEASRIARNLREAGHPEPLGSACSGVLVLLEQPIGPRIIEATRKSLETVQLSGAYVTWSSTGLLLEEILTVQPTALVSVGAGAALEIDALDYPLSRKPFSEAVQGNWFSWTRSTHGLLLPALAPALDSQEQKKLFWRHFLALRNLPDSGPENAL